VVWGARRAKRLNALASELNERGGEALAVVTDVTQADQVRRLVDAAVDRFGRVDVMFNNAGLMPLSPLERVEIDDCDRTIDVNIRACMELPRRCRTGSVRNLGTSSLCPRSLGTRLRLAGPSM